MRDLLVVATKNKGKLNEIKEITRDLPLNVISMEEAGISEDIDETGSTFEENALIKARAVHGIIGAMVMADDSGLEVDWLNGAPGVHTSRFAGEGASDMDKINKLLGLMKGVPFEKRKARFVCAIAVIMPDGESFTVRGTCEGYICEEPRGKNGFGYDPVFYLEEFGKTMAEIDLDTKNSISHRGKALRLMAEELKRKLKR